MPIDVGYNRINKNSQKSTIINYHHQETRGTTMNNNNKKGIVIYFLSAIVCLVAAFGWIIGKNYPMACLWIAIAAVDFLFAGVLKKKDQQDDNWKE